MKKFTQILAFAAIVMGMASCGFTRPYAVTNNPIGSKVGKSSTKVIFGAGAGMSSNSMYAHYSSVGIRFNKNYGIIDAAKKGKITKIATVDLKYVNYILWGEYTLIVTGE